jgi:hypothetical protein
MSVSSLLVLTAYSVLAAGPAADTRAPAQAARGESAFFDEKVAAHCGYRFTGWNPCIAVVLHRGATDRGKCL